MDWCVIPFTLGGLAHFVVAIFSRRLLYDIPCILRGNSETLLLVANLLVYLSMLDVNIWLSGLGAAVNIAVTMICGFILTFFPFLLATFSVQGPSLVLTPTTLAFQWPNTLCSQHTVSDNLFPKEVATDPALHACRPRQEHA
jgi:hypothetical protein